MLELKKIDLPFAADMITERFDNILELIHPNAFVYGGVLRDIAAGLPLEGDIDIVIAGPNYDYCISKITASAKWRSCLSKLDTLVKGAPKPGYRHSKTIRKVLMFETFAGRKVELVRAQSQLSEGYIDASIEVVKAVDIKCCGLIMDIYGNAFEVIEGAYQDCLDRVLRLNKLDSGFNVENLKHRVAKLKDRGWTSKVNMSRAKKTLEKINEAAKKEYMKKLGKSGLKVSVIKRRSDMLELKIAGYDRRKIAPEVSAVVKHAMRELKFHSPFTLAGNDTTLSVQFQLGVKITPEVRQTIAKIGKEVERFISECIHKEMQNKDKWQPMKPSQAVRSAKGGRLTAKLAKKAPPILRTRRDASDERDTSTGVEVSPGLRGGGVQVTSRTRAEIAPNPEVRYDDVGETYPQDSENPVAYDASSYVFETVHLNGEVTEEDQRRHPESPLSVLDAPPNPNVRTGYGTVSEVSILEEELDEQRLTPDGVIAEMSDNIEEDRPTVEEARPNLWHDPNDEVARISEEAERTPERVPEEIDRMLDGLPPRYREQYGEDR